MAASRSRFTFVLAAVLGLGVAHPAYAGDPADPNAGQRAVEIGMQAKTFYEQGRFADALEKFREADGIVHSPVFTLYIARAERRVGELLAARADFQKLLAEPLEANAPGPWIAAHEDAKTELAQLEPQIPRVTLSLDSTGATAAPADVDGQPFVWSKPFEIDPGEHTVHIASKPPYEQKFTITEGASSEVKITPPAPSEGPTRRPLEGPGPSKTTTIVVPATPGSVVPGALLLSIGGAAVITGGVFMGVALAARGEVDPACVATNDPGCVGQTYDDSKDANDRAGLFGNTSTGLFIGGGVAAAIGAILVVVRPGGTPGTTKPVEVTLGPAFVGVRGAF